MDILERNDNVSPLNINRDRELDFNRRPEIPKAKNHHEERYVPKNLRMLKKNCYTDKINDNSNVMPNLEKDPIIEEYSKIEKLKAYQKKFLEMHPRNELFIKHFNEYISEIERLTETKIPEMQKQKILEFVTENPLQHLTKEERNQAKKQYNLKRGHMIKDWELNTGKKWPYSGSRLKNERGRLLSNKPVRHQLHHIILISYGGPNKWWNSHPAHNDAHVKIHGKESVSKRIFENKRHINN